MRLGQERVASQGEGKGMWMLVGENLGGKSPPITSVLDPKLRDVPLSVRWVSIYLCESQEVPGHLVQSRGIKTCQPDRGFANG